MKYLSRREIAKGLGLVAGAVATHGGTALAAPMDIKFPKGFVWGCATAAYQIEGAVAEDGRGPSVWDIFSHTPGKIANGNTGDVACDSYHRYGEDTNLLRNLGAKAYRFSIAWSRIFPEGRGQPNAKGVDHYKRVIDNLLKNGIDPYVTLFHWDLPAALPNGWQSRDTAKAFADYAGYMAGQLSDRVRHFMTINEFRCFTDLSYAPGSKFAPGLQLAAGDLNQVRHHGVLAHGLGVQAIRANARAETQVGLADNPTIPVPVIESPEHVTAAQAALRAVNAPFLTAVLDGRYLDSYLAAEGANAPHVTAGDMKAIGAPIDFVGVNVYTPIYVRADQASPAGFAIVPFPASAPRMVVPWLYLGPEAVYWAVRQISDLWKPRAIFVSENGCPSADTRVGGRIDDSDRIMYLRNYLTHLHRAAAEKYPIRGYFLWSLMDNFEWADGFTTRFGIHYTDYETQQRIPKLSAHWYRELIARNAVV